MLSLSVGSPVQGGFTMHPFFGPFFDVFLAKTEIMTFDENR